MAKRKKERVYDLGGDSVIVKLRKGVGGNFAKNYDGTPAIFEIGADCGEWPEFVGALVHEAKEFADMRTGCRFVITGDTAKDNGSYVFVETHLQHAEVSARVGWFLADCLPHMQKAWRKWQNEEKKVS